MALELKYDKNWKIYSFIREKYLESTPEEIVRQDFVCKLVNEYWYNLDQMDEEVLLTISQRWTGKARADIVVWKTKEEKLSQTTAFLVVELKASYINLKVEDCYQWYNYATWSRAKLFAVSNGKELQVYKTIEEKLPLSLSPVNDIPNSKDILDNSKIEEFLSKTKEFTGDEFSKVLQKCHNIIRNNDKLSPESAFDEISKILFIKIMYERKPKQEAIFSSKQFAKLKDAWNLSRWSSETETSYMQRLFEDVKQEFKNDEIFDKNEKINLREISFEQIVKELEIYNLTTTSSDVKWIAFEKFLWRTLRGELGQFFTPRSIVNFMVDVLEPTEWELICDPSCGSGWFLIKAFEKIKEEIAKEFILKKQEKQKEIFWENLEKIDDENLNKIYEKYLQEINLEEEKRITNLCHNSIFWTDANPRMARVSKMNMIMHWDGHNGIHHNDGLLNVNGIFENRFDVILANPPFGARVPKDLKIEEWDKYKDEEKKKYYLEKYWNEYIKALNQVEWNIWKNLVSLYDVWAYSTLTEVLFLERNLRLLKAGWRMWVVLPEWVLNNSNLQKVRDYFEWKAKILLITSIPQDVFIASWATVKPSLVFLKKFSLKEEAEYKNISEEVKGEVWAEFDEQIKSKNVLLKATKEKEAKEIIKQEIKEIESKKEEKIKKLIKERFNYSIAIAEVQKAWISTTWAIIENELEPLAKEFGEYRKQNNLW